MEIDPKFVKITLRVMRSPLLFQFLNEVGLYLGLEARNRAFKYFSSAYFTEN